MSKNFTISLTILCTVLFACKPRRSQLSKSELNSDLKTYKFGELLPRSIIIKLEGFNDRKSKEINRGKKKEDRRSIGQHLAVAKGKVSGDVETTTLFAGDSENSLIDMYEIKTKGGHLDDYRLIGDAAPPTGHFGRNQPITVLRNLGDTVLFVGTRLGINLFVKKGKKWSFTSWIKDLPTEIKDIAVTYGVLAVLTEGKGTRHEILHFDISNIDSNTKYISSVSMDKPSDDVIYHKLATMRSTTFTADYSELVDKVHIIGMLSDSLQISGTGIKYEEVLNPFDKIILKFLGGRYKVRKLNVSEFSKPNPSYRPAPTFFSIHVDGEDIYLGDNKGHVQKWVYKRIDEKNKLPYHRAVGPKTQEDAIKVGDENSIVSHVVVGKSRRNFKSSIRSCSKYLLSVIRNNSLDKVIVSCMGRHTISNQPLIKHYVKLDMGSTKILDIKLLPFQDESIAVISDTTGNVYLWNFGVMF